MWTVNREAGRRRQTHRFERSTCPNQPFRSQTQSLRGLSRPGFRFPFKEKSKWLCVFHWFCTTQRWAGSTWEERCWDQRNPHVRQQFHPSQVKFQMSKNVRSHFPKILFIKDMSRRINTEGNFGRWCQLYEAICSWATRFRSLACADLWISLVLHRPQASTGPPTLTFYLLPTEFRQHFAWFTFSALTCATQPETPKTTSPWVKPVKPPLHKEAFVLDV